MTKKPFMTNKQWILCLLLGIGIILLTFLIIYFQNSVTLTCANGEHREIKKEDLSEQEEICGGFNYYKYNDNRGLGAYFLDRNAVERARLEYEKKDIIFLE